MPPRGQRSRATGSASFVDTEAAEFDIAASLGLAVLIARDLLASANAVPAPHFFAVGIEEQLRLLLPSDGNDSVLLTNDGAGAAAGWETSSCDGVALLGPQAASVGGVTIRAEAAMLGLGAGAAFLLFGCSAALA